MSTRETERAAWEAGFKLAVGYGDNWFHFHGEQKERQWNEYLASSAVQPEPPNATVDEDDAATKWLLQAMDDLYPLPDDDRRTERAGRTCYALKQWMAAKVAELQTMLPKLMERFKVAPVQPESPWRSMESAPKDGTKVLVYVERDGHHWQIVARTLDRLDGWYSDPGKHLVKATHWMPLPAPPSSDPSVPETKP
jgi:hypothetical protein